MQESARARLVRSLVTQLQLQVLGKHRDDALRCHACACTLTVSPRISPGPNQASPFTVTDRGVGAEPARAALCLAHTRHAAPPASHRHTGAVFPLHGRAPAAHAQAPRACPGQSSARAPAQRAGAGRLRRGRGRAPTVMTQMVSLVNRRLRASMRRPDARLLPLPARAARACCCRACAPGSAGERRAHHRAPTGPSSGAARRASAAPRHRRRTRRASPGQGCLPAPGSWREPARRRPACRWRPTRAAGLGAACQHAWNLSGPGWRPRARRPKHAPRVHARCAPAPADHDMGARHASARGPIPYTLYPIPGRAPAAAPGG